MIPRVVTDPSAEPVPAHATSIDFAHTVRVVGSAARDGGLEVPAFRSPPRDPDLDRAVTRRPDGSIVVAVRLGGRPFAAVEADVIEGVVHVNELRGVEASRWRRLLWQALAEPVVRAA